MFAATTYHAVAIVPGDMSPVFVLDQTAFVVPSYLGFF